MTTEEALAAAQVNDTGADEVITIDNDLRTIIIPASITLLGVVSDENVQTLHFQMPKTYKGLDLSEFAIRINYNPQALTITYGGKAHIYDGSEAIAITIETGGIERIEKLSTDTTVTLEPNKLYVFPEMESLAYTIGEGAGEIHFIFKSGATATRVVHPAGVNIGSFTVDANKIYEVSILEGLLTSQSWAVS